LIAGALAITVGVTAAVGLALAMSRDLVRAVIGLVVLGSAANLFVFAAGRIEQAAPPLVPVGSESVAGLVANPVPQALVLTAIVIGFAIASFAIALVLRIQETTGASDSLALRWAEPAPRDGGDPGELT
jgi:multicomponent Na+:H+ antiporter subunit C